LYGAAEHRLSGAIASCHDDDDDDAGIGGPWNTACTAPVEF